MSNQVKDMTWREVQERLREFPVVIVPIGSTEQHGYHLPIGTDVYLAEALAEKTAEKNGSACVSKYSFWVFLELA
ncbi:MAG: creatininase family protein [[Ruminococcus] torques]